MTEDDWKFVVVLADSSADIRKALKLEQNVINWTNSLKLNLQLRWQRLLHEFHYFVEVQLEFLRFSVPRLPPSKQQLYK